MFFLAVLSIFRAVLVRIRQVPGWLLWGKTHLKHLKKTLEPIEATTITLID